MTLLQSSSAGLLLGLAVLVSGGAGAAAPPEGEGAFEVALQTIKAPDLTRHGAFLSSDALEGRNCGSRGEGIAALYIADQLRGLGVNPGGTDGTYFQHVPLSGDRLGFNVVGRIDGTDPELRHEVVVVGAHYDHLGIDRRGEIYNGADDNASGTSAVLEFAEAFRLLPPRRSILVAFFCGEEQGLLGSKYYCEHPLVPLPDTVAMINLDMVGRSEDDYLFVGGAGTSPVFRPLVAGWNRRFGFEMEVKDPGGAPSDSMSFFNRGIPVLFFFTNVHEDYHRPTDDWERVNLEGMERIARLVFAVASDVANADERPEFVKKSGMALPATFMERMRGRGR